MKIASSMFLIAILLSGTIVINIDFAHAQEFPENYVKDRLLIKFKDFVSENQKKGILKQNNAIQTDEISQIDVLILNVPENALEKIQNALSKNPAVEYVEKDWILEPTQIPNDPNYSSQWHLTKIGADKAWDTTKGDSAPIAILDTGIDSTHEDLAAKIQNKWNFYDNNDNLTDSCGHGTKVAGAAAAISNNGLGVAGVAWNNPIIPIKITDSSCNGYYSKMIQGITYAADKGAKVANISFRVFNGDALSSAAQYMHSSGGWVVVAGGNTGNFENYSDNPYVISVAATSSSDTVSSFSSYGPFIDFAAPGSGIYTTRTNDSYGSSSGTSFASPITAGAIALVFASDSSLSPDDVYNKLKDTAVDLGSSGRDYNYGWGRINLATIFADTTPVVDNVAPTVAITSPANNSDVTGSFIVSVDASDETSLEKVELYINGILSQQDTTIPYEFSVDGTALNSGSNQVEVKAVDSSNNSASDQIAVNVLIDSTAPTVAITNPTDGQIITGKTRIVVLASDDSEISKVEIFIDGTLKSTLTGSTYEYNWNPKGASGGTHTISSVATDISGNSAETSIDVILEKGGDKNGKGGGKPQGKK
ncbi:MAG: S8 family serine peptidase [Nitrosopumilus sp.]|jgi:subtilisin family serine protease